MATKALGSLCTETFVVSKLCIVQVCSHLRAHRLVHVPFGMWHYRVSAPCSHLPLRDSAAKRTF